jgi:two-component system, sensor histidine kinase RegB
MRVSVTGRGAAAPPDLRPAGELAPTLALPWIAKLRYGVLAGQILLILTARFAFNVELAIGWLALPLGLMAASNVLLYGFAEKFGARQALGYLLAFDTICLTALLALSGGPANPFTLLYLVQITLSAVVLSKQWTWLLGVLSALGFAFLFWANVPVSVFEMHHTTDGFSIHLVGMWIAFAAGALLITVFIGKVSEALRRREQEVLRLQHQLARHERLGSIATLAAGAAHELGTPLGTIAVASKELEFYATKISKDQQVVEDARLIRSEVERCSRILKQMSARGAEQPGESPVAVALSELLESVRRGLPLPAQQRVQVTAAGDTGGAVLPVEAVKQALTALVKNALEASGEQQWVRLGVEPTATGARFTVVDSGSGMSQETLNRVAEPFFTTKAAGGGMGLGTFLARALAERLGGGLFFESEPGKGCTAILELPLTCYDEQRKAGGVNR